DSRIRSKVSPAFRRVRSTLAVKPVAQANGPSRQRKRAHSRRFIGTAPGVAVVRRGICAAAVRPGRPVSAAAIAPVHRAALHPVACWRRQPGTLRDGPGRAPVARPGPAAALYRTAGAGWTAPAASEPAVSCSAARPAAVRCLAEAGRLEAPALAVVTAADPVAAIVAVAVAAGAAVV